MTLPTTRYARSGEVSIAYQVVGTGPDLLWTPGFMSHLDVFWADPDIARFMRLLSSFSRLIVYDKRGTGLSDPVPRPPTLEERVEDLTAVLDAAGSTRAAILGFSEGAAASILFAARSPERVSALIPYGAILRGTADAEHPWGVAESTYERMGVAIDHWGDGRSMEVFAPSIVPSAISRRIWGIAERTCASPSMARALVAAWRQTDVGHVLPSIRVPTVVLHRRGDEFPIAAAHVIAERIVGARLVELDGADHVLWIGDSESVVGEIEQVVTGARRGIDPSSALVTVLFIDIVGSTERAAALGDVQWRALLERYRRVTRQEVVSAGGRIVDTSGDGLFIEADSVTSAIECAHNMIASVRELALEIRAGVHCGECQRIDDGLVGVTVHIGARVCALASSGEVLVTAAAAALAPDAGFTFSSRSVRRLKGVPGEWELLVASPRGLSNGVSSNATHWHTRRDRFLVGLARAFPGPLRLLGAMTRRRRE